MSPSPIHATRRGRAVQAPGAHCISLIDLPPGKYATLCGTHTETGQSEWLVSLGFVPGTRLRVIRGAPLGGPVEIEIRGTRVCVRKADLADFFVTVESET